MTKENLRIVFFGTPEFAVASLAALVDNGYNIVGVVTMPDKEAGRGHKLIQSPVKQYALAHNLPLMQPPNLKDPGFIDDLRQLHADLFIVIAFRMLPEAVWQMPPLGTFNLHASLLPLYRGAAPINRAVMNGDTRTGVTTFMLKHEIDTGDILQQTEVDILPDEDVGAVHDKLMMVGAGLTLETVEKIIAGSLSPIPQDSLLKDAVPTPAPKIFAEDMLIDWRKPAVQIHNQVRGLSPYPLARAKFCANPDSEFSLMKICRTTVSDKSLSPGQISLQADRLFVGAGDGKSLEILELQPAGKKRMSTQAFLNGARLSSPYFMIF